MSINITFTFPELNAKLDKLDKRGKYQLLEEKHKELFKKEGINGPAKFIPRMAYFYEGEKIISLYPSEINGAEDVYTEFVSKEYHPEDKDRKLYKWIFNADYQTEYKMSAPHPVTGDKRFLIPVEELIDVEAFHKEKELTSNTLLSDFDAEPSAGTDVPYADMTLRDYAAIQLKTPCSNKKWLNEIINKTK
jgi:hypothetical protein